MSREYVEKIRALEMAPGDVIRVNNGEVYLYIGADGCWDTEFGVLDDSEDKDLEWGAFTELGDIASSYDYKAILDDNPVVVLRKGFPVTDNKVINHQQSQIESLRHALFQIEQSVRSIVNSV